MLRGNGRLAYAGVAALLVLGSASCGVLDPEEPAGQDQILFISGRNNAYDIYRMNADGSGVVNLTRSPDAYRSLDITPDGRTVIFSTAGGCDIWTMAVDGSARKTIGESCSRTPHLSPDGGLVAYASDNTIHVMALDGTASREVSAGLPPIQPSSCGQTPNWHVWPFGWVSANRVAFRRHICGVGTTFYAVDADGTDLTEIDFNPQTAHLSPDATQIAFDRVDDVSVARSVTVMNVNGTNVRTVVAEGGLPDNFFVSRTPWSPDGNQLYFYSDDGHHIADLRSTGSRDLLQPPPDAAFLGWSPRGDRMLFMVNERDNSNVVVSSDIHVVNADGTGLTNLTRSSSFDIEAVWVPRR